MRPRPLCVVLLCALALAVPAVASASSSATTGATLTGTVAGPAGEALAGMPVQALPAGASACTAATGCVSTVSGAGGAFTLRGVAPGVVDLDVVDGPQTVTADTVTVPARGAVAPLALTLGPAEVPAGTVAVGSMRALGWLNAERRAAGLGSVALNPRWSQECAAHDRYEVDNGTLQSTENPAASGYSPGGAWAGLSADLAQGRWTPAVSPWQNAPVNLLALLAPSLSVTGIDDSPQRQCAITFPGMVRPAPRRDTIHTVPADGARGVPTSELARESPFTPVQFVGLPATRTTGRELLVYLNRAGLTGQAPVQIVHATLSRAGRSVPVRFVDASTRTLGRDLAGALLIPVSPMRPFATYRASVTVRDGAGTLTHVWTFTTGG